MDSTLRPSYVNKWRKREPTKELERSEENLAREVHERSCGDSQMLLTTEVKVSKNLAWRCLGTQARTIALKW